VIVLCMGPPQAEETLRQAIAMGANQAILLTDRRFALADTLATAYTLATAIQKIGEYDLLLFGKQAIDGDTAQVGPGVAEALKLPQITYARKVQVSDGTVTAERVLEDSYEIVEAQLPVVVTVVKEINEPRHASLRGVMKAKKAEILRLAQSSAAGYYYISFLKVDSGDVVMYDFQDFGVNILRLEGNVFHLDDLALSSGLWLQTFHDVRADSGHLRTVVGRYDSRHEISAKCRPRLHQESLLSIY